MELKNEIETGFEQFVHPRKILVATDLMDEHLIMPHGIAQARATDSEPVLVHALEMTKADEGLSPLVVSDELRVQRKHAIHQLEGMKWRLEMQGVRCSIKADPGHPLNLIHEALLSENAGRVIAATHGRRHLRELVFGSVAKELMASVPVPLFLVGPHGEHEGLQSIQRILCPVSLDGDYRRITQFALALAKTHRAHIMLVHVLDEILPEDIQPLRQIHAARNALCSLADQATCLKEQISIRVVGGPVAKTLLRLARQTKADAIVMGTREPFPISRVKDCLAYKIVAAAQCPVFTCRFDLAVRKTANVIDKPAHA